MGLLRHRAPRNDGVVWIASSPAASRNDGVVWIASSPAASRNDGVVWDCFVTTILAMTGWSEIALARVRVAQ